MKRTIHLSIPVAVALALVGCSNQERDAKAGEPTSSVNYGKHTDARASVVSNTLDCTNPVKADEDADAVLQRFGRNAQEEELAGDEGATLPGLVLWGSDPKRRIELMLSDTSPAKIVGWRIGEGSTWAVQGIRIGDPIARLAKVNESPFRFYGFSWDYGGYVTDWEGGTLDDLPGGCEISVRLNPQSESLPDAVMGEGELSSDDPLVAKTGAVVGEISVSLSDAD